MILENSIRVKETITLTNQIVCNDSLEFMKEQADYSTDIIYSDPPYGLGSEVIIRPDGKPDYEKLADFMNKWDMPTGDYWEKWFKEAFRTLKYGGYCIMFGMDRQLLLFKYYAHLAEFSEHQSLYWYFICLSSDSEILTDNGWRKIDTIKETDKVADFDLLTKQIVFRKPKKIHKYDFDGELVHIANKDTEQLLTLNHRCVIFEEGELIFKYAYELIGKQTRIVAVDKATIWEISLRQKMQTMWQGFSSWWKATQEAILRVGVFQEIHIGNKKRETIAKPRRKGNGKLFSLWQRVLQVAERCQENKLLQSSLQDTKILQIGSEKWVSKQRKKEDFRTNTKNEGWCYSWFKALVLEGWNNLQKIKGQLFGGEVCLLSARIFGYGSERWLCYGTSVSSSKGVSDIKENGNCSSYQSQGMGQSIRELTTIQEQSRTQEIRIGTRYKTSLAIPKLKQYKGRVWCVETSTGAFIARRNGRAFITGNSNFPKVSDLSKNIDKNAGMEREIIGHIKAGKTALGQGSGWHKHENTTKPAITISATSLAKKYDGYKYSISPLKQTNETIMVFQKSYKTGSCLHDTLAMENGNKQCVCGALDIDGGRVPVVGEENPTGSAKRVFKSNQYTDEKVYGDNTETSPSGRYPAQTFIDSETANVLDEQSGVKKPSGSVKGTEPSKTGTENCYGIYDRVSFNAHQDIGGVSKILHKCDFEAGEHDLYFYCPKVNKSERNAGLDGFDDNIPMYEQYHRKNAQTTKGIETPYAGAGRGGGDLRNNHPTLKPISLNTRILKLFKTPNPQRILFPFAGSGSEIIGGIKAGFTDWQGCEISQDYIDIANARIKYWIEQSDLQGSLFNLNDDDMKPIEQESSQDDLFKGDEC